LKICNDDKTNFRSESNSCGAIFDVSRSREIIASLEAKTSHPDFWQDQEQAQKILQQRKVAEGVLASDAKLARMLSDIETYFSPRRRRDRRGPARFAAPGYRTRNGPLPMRMSPSLRRSRSFPVRMTA